MRAVTFAIFFPYCNNLFHETTDYIANFKVFNTNATSST